jgi:hypothetical protein
VQISAKTSQMISTIAMGSPQIYIYLAVRKNNSTWPVDWIFICHFTAYRLTSQELQFSQTISVVCKYTKENGTSGRRSRCVEAHRIKLPKWSLCSWLPYLTSTDKVMLSTRFCFYSCRRYIIKDPSIIGFCSISNRRFWKAWLPVSKHVFATLRH